MAINKSPNFKMHASEDQVVMSADAQQASECLNAKEIVIFSQMLVNFHLITQQLYKCLFSTNQCEDFYEPRYDHRKIFMPKCFSVSMFKQMALYFSVYMRRIRENEAHKIQKLDIAFGKIAQVEHKLQHYDLETEDLNKKLMELENKLAVWDEKIEQQKSAYKTAVDEFRKEEKLIEEMNANLEKLRPAVNMESQGQANAVNQQYEMARAIEVLNKNDFNELKSFRSPPQRVLAVMNTLCLMFWSTSWMGFR